MFQPGMIRKIEVKNFVTYTHAELIPGPNLNMIIGPNGTGKSTMVAAVILGLGGSPKVVGRGKKVSEYVKYNCEHATIDIYLQDNKANTFVHITRQFDIHDKNVWKLNGNQMKLPGIVSYLTKFNIQVDNLCQFLPQDRVQDFSKMNKQELLKQTQIALCRTDLLEMHESLISSRTEHKNIIASIAKQEKMFEDLKETNARLEGKVKNFNKKKKYTDLIQHIERKIAWSKFDEIKIKLQEAKADKAKATECYEKRKKLIEPIKKELATGNNTLKSIQHGSLRNAQVLKNVENTIRSNTENIMTLKDSLRKIDDDAQLKISEIQNRQQEIDSNKSKLDEMKNLYSEIVVKIREDDKKRESFMAEIQRMHNTKEKFEEKQEQLLEAKGSKAAEVRALESEIKRFENVKDQRLQLLQRMDQHAYQGVLWLRENKHLFKSEVFEPIILELNVFDQKNAIYIGNIIPKRDRIAFTCVDKSDMNLLIQQLRSKLKLTVNVVHSGDTGKSLNEFQPVVPIEHMTKYGFYTYVHSLFTAPEPILRYLYKTYKLYNIPVGNAKTNQCFNDVPKEIRQFFSDKFKYSITYSKYSSEKSVRQNQIRPDSSFSISLDVLKLEKIKGHLEQIRSKHSSYDEDINKCMSQIQIYTGDIAMLKDKFKELGGKKQHANILQNKIKALSSKIVDMEQNKLDEESIITEANQRKMIIVNKVVTFQSIMKNDLKKYSELFVKNQLSTFEEDMLTQKNQFLQNKIEESRDSLKTAELTLNRIVEVYSNIAAETKTVLHKAKSLSNGFTPNDDGFDEFREQHDNLSDDIQQLTTDKEQIEIKINCLNTADDGEMQAYADREKDMEKLQTNIEKSQRDLNKISSQIDKAQVDWLNPLKQLISDINEKFSRAYERMGCAGEISLYIGDNEKDFSDYGISIKVTYRNNMPLQELNRTVQSGGERAVATATYMLSLQELTPVPFRCVDEINQGMDSNNERRMFELLVESTSQANTSQYFLITPKLIPNLKFSKSMMVHVVHNGPFIVQDRKWSFTKLCNLQGAQVY